MAEKTDRAPKEKSHHQGKLEKAVLEKSVATTFNEAKKEWDLLYIYKQAQGGVCICGHSPIVDHCVLRNHLNSRRLVVGNVCVEKFNSEQFQLSSLAFKCLGNMKKDEKKRANDALLKFARDQGLITEKDYNFYSEVRLKRRRISGKQRDYIDSLNKTMVFAFTHPPQICKGCEQHVWAKQSRAGKLYYRCNPCSVFLDAETTN